MADDTSPFLSDDTPAESLARLSPAGALARPSLPEPIAGKWRAILYQPRRRARFWAWFVPAAIGAALVAVAVSFVYAAYAEDGLGAALGWSLLGVPLAFVGSGFILGAIRLEIAATRGRRPAAQATAQADGSVTIRAAATRWKGTFGAGATVMVTKISPYPAKLAPEPLTAVTIADAAADGDPKASVAIVYRGDYDDDAHDRLRQGLRLYGLRAPQTFSDLPAPTELLPKGKA